MFVLIGILLCKNAQAKYACIHRGAEAGARGRLPSLLLYYAIGSLWLFDLLFNWSKEL